MPRRTSKKAESEDEVQSAKRVFDSLISAESQTVYMSVVSRVMSEMGKKGGSKGGKMRLVTLTPERRSEIASLAAKKRWSKKTKKSKA